MKHQHHTSSQNASQTYERRRWVTITFPDSPFLSQEGRLVKVTLGIHSDIHLELSDGKRIRIDATWTDYDDASRSHRLTPRIDLLQIQPIVELLEYLNDKQNQHAQGHNAIQAE